MADGHCARYDADFVMPTPIAEFVPLTPSRINPVTDKRKNAMDNTAEHGFSCPFRF